MRGDRFSRHGKPSGGMAPFYRYSGEAWKEYVKTPKPPRSDEDEASLQDLRKRPSREWNQAERELYDDIMARDDDREDVHRAPLRKDLEGRYDHLNLAPLPPPLPRSSLWITSRTQGPSDYNIPEVRSFLIACTEGSLDEVKRCVQEKKEALRQRGLQDGLDCAAKGNQVDVARYLLEEGGAFLDGAVVDAACENHSLPLFELCVQHGYHPNQQIPGSGYGVALLQCLQEKHEDIARFLIQNGADPDLARFHDNRCMNWGERSSPPMDRASGLPLDRAVESGGFSTVQMLLEHGANPKYARPLHRVVERRHPRDSPEPDLNYDWRPVMEMLLRYGADINAVTWGWGTALHVAAFKKAWDIAEFLLEHGADPRIKSPSSKIDSFASAAKYAGVDWDEAEEVKKYLNYLCDAKSISDDGGAPPIHEETRKNPLVAILERVKRRKGGEAEGK
ncbi:Fc.00g079740.m01.CDS01 [Cosmosporella sp. VM-42]